MGLTNRSTGAHAADGMLAVVKRRETDSVVALAGNPNVGKSTVFNELTGMNQHTGNWPGKTVASAQGYCERGGWGCVLVDIPGCYSLMAHSAEEAVARDFICFGGANAVVVVCDASCLERNLNLALQAMEITDNVVLCVNLMDEARRKGVEAALLEQRLGVPVVPAAARSGEGLPELMYAVERVIRGECAARGWLGGCWADSTSAQACSGVSKGRAPDGYDLHVRGKITKRADGVRGKIGGYKIAVFYQNWYNRTSGKILWRMTFYPRLHCILRDGNGRRTQGQIYSQGALQAHGRPA